MNYYNTNNSMERRAPCPSGHQQPQQQHQRELVPHYGPGGQYPFDSSYQNYQIPLTSKPEYINYASSTVATTNNASPDLFMGSYVQQSKSGSTADDLFEVSSNTVQDDAFISSFSKEDLAEQERLMKEIQERNSVIVPKATNDMTVYAQQDRLWNSIHQEHHHQSSLVPHSTSSYPSTMTVYEPSNENKIIHVPRSHNPTGSDAVHPRRAEMKQARKVNTATAATGGAIVGGVLFGPAWPLGVVVGGAAGAVAGKQISKAGERRAQRKWEKKSFQHYATSESAVAKGGASFA
jgi:hypothetical protein